MKTLVLVIELESEEKSGVLLGKVREAIKSLKMRKAPGCDSIDVRML